MITAQSFVSQNAETEGKISHIDTRQTESSLLNENCCSVYLSEKESSKLDKIADRVN